MKRLVDGECRDIRASRAYSMFRNDRFRVEAERYDCDTPFVHLTIGKPPFSTTAALTDVEALDLIDRLQRALDVLPSSK